MSRATSKRRRAVLAGAFSALLGVLASGGCARTTAIDAPPPPPHAPPDAAPPAPATSAAAATASTSASPSSPATGAAPWAPPPPSLIDGPHQELLLEPGRPVYYALPRPGHDAGAAPLRLVAHLHGMCGPPPYACGRWIGAGTSVGGMVCPTGNARCGDSPVSPASWEAASWPELVGIMDHDLETSIAKVEKKRGPVFRRSDAVLTGYSRGAFAAPVIAQSHPGRWPYLVLIEANAPLSAATLRRAGVRAVALVAGELGTEIAGMRKSEHELRAAGLPARLFVMRKTGHPYSDDMEDVMHAALEFVLAEEGRDAGP